jgi:hypothetical protein
MSEQGLSATLLQNRELAAFPMPKFIGVQSRVRDFSARPVLSRKDVTLPWVSVHSGGNEGFCRG